MLLSGLDAPLWPPEAQPTAVLRSSCPPSPPPFPGGARTGSGRLGRAQLWPRLGRACPLPAALLVQAPRQPQEPWLDVACDHIPALPTALCLFAALFLPQRCCIRRDAGLGAPESPTAACPPPHLVLNPPPLQQPSRSDGRRQRLRRPPAGAPAHLSTAAADPVGMHVDAVALPWLAP